MPRAMPTNSPPILECPPSSSSHTILHNMQRVDKFVGTQEQYIAYLESRCMEQSQLHRVLSQKYERLLRHHESCAASIIQYNNDLRPYGASPESSSFLQYQKSLNSNGSHRKFIHWNYSAQRFHLKQAIRRPPQVPRWQHLADDLIEKTPIGSRWWTMLSDIGIGSLSEVSTALEFLLEHNTSTAIFPRLPSTEVAIVQPARCDMLLDYVTAYATALKARDISTNVTSMLVNFSKFLFVDLCIVLESEGVEKDDVNNMMRITISDATDLSLDRIKRAVKWTNSMCDKLSARWGLRAGMLPLICCIQRPMYPRRS